ncbi:MAG: PepSY-associated TM helix domain-containing protein, partial [Piscinibacter sp.]|uniref:PepSY-associated TM helix domain-containing protein n=1 Tax=Piscinibacter sp. TaxID=1903157 RepID=UPI003D0C2C4D
SLLVFYTELDALLNPRLAWRPADGTVHRYEPVLRALQAAHPQRDGSWRIELPPRGQGLVTARYLRPRETAGEGFAPLLATVHPARHEVLASRFWGDTAMTWVYDLHYTLLAGDAGRWAVGGLGALLAASLLTGVWLWWPTPVQRAAAWRLKRGAGRPRQVFDLHRLGGIYPLLLTALLALTGVVLAWPEVIEPAVARLSPPLTVVPPRAEPPYADAAFIGIDAALHRARERFPQGVPRWIDTPEPATGAYRIRLQQPGEPSERFPRTLVWIDAWRGDVLAVRDARVQGAGDTLLAWVHPLHNGEAFGLPGRLLVCAAGFVPLLLAITGTMRWLDRRRGERARRSRLAALSAPAP